MFQLVAAVVGILLLAIIVIAALYYGSGAHSDAKIRADYSGNMNTGSQIEGALRLYFNDHAMYPPSRDPETNEELVDTALLNFLVKKQYLKEIPSGDWTVNPQTLSRPIKNQTVEECSSMNRVAGFKVDAATDLAGEPYKGCPPCSGAPGTPEEVLFNKYKSWPVCQLID